MDLGIAGRVAMVIGGARGIGFAVASELAAAGAKVVIADIDGANAAAAASKLAKAGGAETCGVAMDISSLDNVAAGFKQAEARLGAPAIVVNTAAIVDDKLFAESGPSDWRRMIDICLVGPMNVLHVALPSMQKARFGRIVCFASDSARVGQARLSYYAAAKAGVIALAKSVAQEVGKDGITLNVVSPGATNTELRQNREAAMRAEMGDAKYKQREEKVVRMYPLRRIGQPDDVAGMTAFLVSERASWITGQVVSVNGGFVMP